MARRILLFFVVTWSVLSVGSLRSWAAPATPFDLVWQAPPECPTAETVQGEVVRLLGSPSTSVDRLSATAIVARSEHGWGLVLTTEVHGVRGRRTIEAPSCEALAHATALVLALTIDPSRATARDGAEPSSERDGGTADAADAGPEAGAPADADAVEPPPVASALTGAGRPSTIAIAASAVAILGPLPGVAFGAEISAGWSKAGWRLELAAAYFPATRALVDAVRGGDFTLAAGLVRGCRTWAKGALEVGPCVGFEAGTIHGEGVGIRFPGSGVAPWLAVKAGSLAALRLGTTPLWLVLALEAEASLTRYRFAVDGLGIVHQPSAVAGRGSFGAEVRF